MTETIPADIMKAARIAFAQANKQSWWTNTREGETIIARAIMAHTARQEERIKELEANIEGRDKFIVDQGLWQDFVETLPLRATPQTFKPLSLRPSPQREG